MHTNGILGTYVSFHVVYLYRKPFNYTLIKTDFIHKTLYDMLSSFDDASVHIVCEVPVDLGGLPVDGLVERMLRLLKPLSEVYPRQVLRDGAPPKPHHLRTLPEPIHSTQGKRWQTHGMDLWQLSDSISIGQL